ncbi:peptidase M24, structural domain-containing protein [Lactarius quietus]|nr:peptidase M24, structural domain-containing protein [Lactarius quietus]
MSAVLTCTSLSSSIQAVALTTYFSSPHMLQHTLLMHCAMIPALADLLYETLGYAPTADQNRLGIARFLGQWSNLARRRTADTACTIAGMTHTTTYPSPLGYSGFPKACCTSINNIIAHGIPDDWCLEDRDIVNIGITVYLDGYHRDTSQTFLIGNVDKVGKGLVATTNKASDVGIAGYSVSSQFTGHGIGNMFHHSPWILHHCNEEPGTMMLGHCFTIEAWGLGMMDTSCPILQRSQMKQP